MGAETIEAAGANAQIVELVKPTVQVTANPVIPVAEKKEKAVEAAKKAGATPELADQALFGAVAAQEQVSTVTEAKHDKNEVFLRDCDA